MKVVFLFIFSILSFAAYSQVPIKQPMEYRGKVTIDSLRLKPSDTTGVKELGRIVIGRDSLPYYFDGIKWTQFSSGDGSGADVDLSPYAFKLINQNNQNTSYTLTLNDLNQSVNINSASPTNVIVPTNTTTAFPIGSQIIITRDGTGDVNIVPATGVVIHAPDSFKLAAQYSKAYLVKRATNLWDLGGDLKRTDATVIDQANIAYLNKTQTFVGDNTFNKSLNVTAPYPDILGVTVTNTQAGAAAQANVKLQNDLGEKHIIGIYSSSTAPYGTIGPRTSFSYSNTQGGYAVVTDFPTSTIRLAAGGNTPQVTVSSNDVTVTTPVNGVAAQSGNQFPILQQVSDLIGERILASDSGTATPGGVYEPIIIAGTSGQYWAGDKTWKPFPTIGTGSLTQVTAALPLHVANQTTTPYITMDEAHSGQSGYLSFTDWNIFNNKQPPGNYLTGITGRVVAGTNMTRTGSGTPEDPYVFNSTGGGGSSGVTSFNSRSGVVVPLLADYSSFYAALSHTHTISNVTGLQTALDAKVPTSRTITINGTSHDLATDASFTVSGGSTQTTSYQTQTATGGQSAFTFTSVATSLNDFWIDINGAVIAQSFYTKSTNTITFTAGLEAGDVVNYHQVK